MDPLLAFLAFIAAVAAAPFLLSFVVALITEREGKERLGSVPPILFSFYRLFMVVICYLLSAICFPVSAYCSRSSMMYGCSPTFSPLI
ncbi:MAG: hypothetical protein LBE81_13320 [Azonexus sp.]|jgi:hypothetical protein|uniref:hypothetical protein n=1 Tax=Azonexus sp. TaxID=1872668 RepID=UPI0028349298|nr:hypothetical protein [Azonexus sp.]MDR0777597.1 hypothetical protein [Azonexus sp.]